MVRRLKRSQEAGSAALTLQSITNRTPNHEAETSTTKNGKRYIYAVVMRMHGPNNYTVKTANPTCCFYWCLIEFKDWRYSQSCWYFRPLLWTSAPLTFSLVHLTPISPPPPHPVWISTGVCIISLPLKQKPRKEGVLKQINTCRQVPSQVNF